MTATTAPAPSAPQNIVNQQTSQQQGSQAAAQVPQTGAQVSQQQQQQQRQQLQHVNMRNGVSVPAPAPLSQLVYQNHQAPQQYQMQPQFQQMQQQQVQQQVQQQQAQQQAQQQRPSSQQSHHSHPQQQQHQPLQQHQQQAHHPQQSHHQQQQHQMAQQQQPPQQQSQPQQYQPMSHPQQQHHMQSGSTPAVTFHQHQQPQQQPQPQTFAQPQQYGLQVQQTQHHQHYQQPQMQQQQHPHHQQQTQAPTQQQQMPQQQQMSQQQMPQQQTPAQQQLPQQQPPAQQHIVHQGLNGGWQSEKDVNDRRNMIAKIVQLLRQRKPNAPQEWLRKLPQMAKRLEESLYRSAPSFEAYNDMNTLKTRLQQLAMNIGLKTQQAKRLSQQQNPGVPQTTAPAPQPTPAPASAPQQVQYQQQQLIQQGHPQPQYAQPLQQQQPPPPQQPQTYYQAQAPPPAQQMQYGQTLMQQPGQPQQIQYQPPAPSSQTQNRLVNLNEINHYMNPSSSGPSQAQPIPHMQQQPVAMPPMSMPTQVQQPPPQQQSYPQQPQPQAQPRPAQPQNQQTPQYHQQPPQQTYQVPQQIQVQAPAPTAYAPQQPMSQQMQVPQHPGITATHVVHRQPTPSNGSVGPVQPNQAPSVGGSVQAPPTGANATRSSSDRQQVLRHQQQRLLLLRHAAKCPHEDNRCPVTPHCAGMKRLWKHIAECKNQKCLVPHCVSSRYVLSHYHRCRDVKCPVCGPVREAIHRSHEKAKMLQKQREQQQQQGQAPPQAATQLQPQPQPPQGQALPPTQMSAISKPPTPAQGPVPAQPHFRPQQAPTPAGYAPQPLPPVQQQPMMQQQTQPPGTYAVPIPNSNSNQHGVLQPKPPQPSVMQPQSLQQQSSASRIAQPDLKRQKVQSPPAQSSAPAPTSGMPQGGLASKGLAPIGPVQSNYQVAQSQPVQSQMSPQVPSAPVVTSVHAQRPGQVVPPPRMAPVPAQTGAATAPGQPPGSRPIPAPIPAPGSAPVTATGPVQGASPGPNTAKPGTPGAAVGSKPGPPGQRPGMAPKLSASKVKEDHTLINSFSIEQIETHIASLNSGLNIPPAKLKSKCGEVLKTLQNHGHAWVFNSPVDPVELNLPDYFQIIKKPMDLGTIKKRLENGCYHSIDDFKADALLTFDNAMLYNQEGSVVHNMAKEMKEVLLAEWEKMMKVLHQEEEEKRKNGEACSLCGCEKLLFEPPVFYCNGLNCPNPGKRIRRNSYYYVSSNQQYHWCHQCWGELSEKPIEMAEITVKKQELTKKKNDEIHEESWVQCDKCERWIHQICALFNTRQNKDQRSEYICPRCTIEDRKSKGQFEGISKTPMAEDLPRTKLSEWLENHVRTKMDIKFDELAKEKAVEENISYEEAKKGIGMGGHITIRQVTSMDRKLEVRERMKARYAFKNYPSEFPFRCKCIVVFQNLDGVDVMLFGLYVYEHGPDNPAPNARSVYVSYLDSVHYMRPRKMRTFIYHEILISYLDYVRIKGFATAHIWACPPLKGDDYIMYAKPEDQKTPKDDRLRQWYLDMLVECQRRGIVGRITNMYDLYFANEKNDATVVPYMDGDYFPSEVENVIKDLEEGKRGDGGSGKKNKKKTKTKQKGGRGGTRSTGIDEEALKASGILPPGSDAKSIEEGGRDFVMKKIADTIQPMKESFIVAFLAWEKAKKEDLVVPKEIAEYREKMGFKCKSLDFKAQAEEAGKSGSDVEVKKDDVQVDNDESKVERDKLDSETEPPNDKSQDLDTTENDRQDSTILAEQASSLGDNNRMSNTTTPPVNMGGKVKPEIIDKSNSKKRDFSGEIKADSTHSMSAPAALDSDGKPVKIIDDDAEEMDCEFLNNRQAFLNLCQGNHYQFDQLRRAKHTSMMTLWHLHNRDAPKFVQQCALCSREILTGFRYHCPTCADFDLCAECYQNPNNPRHPHQLKPMAVSSQQSQLTEAQRQERQRSIQLHMQLLQHAAKCHSPKCPSANCNKMKGLLRHGSTCTTKHTGGCQICKRIWALLQIHARQCKQPNCVVPNCMAIRERIRQLTKQQQAMDDRRRQEMNRTYRAGAAR